MSGSDYVVVTEQRPASVAHLVPERQAAALQQGRKLHAMCGRVFHPAALAAPMGRPCSLCEAALPSTRTPIRPWRARGLRRWVRPRRVEPRP